MKIISLIATTVILIFALFTSNSLAKKSYYKCVFDKGTTTNFDSTPNGKSIKDTLNIVFENLDYNQKLGRMVSANGSGEVAIIANKTINFLELTSTGNMTLTTIFQDPKSKYNAVHSRHMDIFGAIVSQYYGVCS